MQEELGKIIFSISTLRQNNVNEKIKTKPLKLYNSCITHK